jgi:hypothetical protein
MTPDGGMYMTNSSFQTENCWMYFGRQLISQEPYRCISSAFAAYLSAGLIGGARSPPGESGSLGACRKFGVSEETTTWALGVDEKARILVSLRRTKAIRLDLKAEAKARWFETLMAIVDCAMVQCRDPNCGMLKL